MVKRIKTVNSALNSLFVIVELLIGVKVLVYSFGSDGVILKVLEDVNQALNQLGYGASTIVRYNNLDGPVTFLIMVLGFMVLGFFLIIIVLPRANSRGEREV